MGRMRVNHRCYRYSMILATHVADAAALEILFFSQFQILSFLKHFGKQCPGNDKADKQFQMLKDRRQVGCLMVMELNMDSTTSHPSIYRIAAK